LDEHQKFTAPFAQTVAIRQELEAIEQRTAYRETNPRQPSPKGEFETTDAYRERVASEAASAQRELESARSNRQSLLAKLKDVEAVVEQRRHPAKLTILAQLYLGKYNADSKRFAYAYVFYPRFFVDVESVQALATFSKSIPTIRCDIELAKQLRLKSDSDDLRVQVVLDAAHVDFVEKDIQIAKPIGERAGTAIFAIAFQELTGRGFPAQFNNVVRACVVDVKDFRSAVPLSLQDSKGTVLWKASEVAQSR
jgi:hypothetical protein